MSKILTYVNNMATKEDLHLAFDLIVMIHLSSSWQAVLRSWVRNSSLFLAGLSVSSLV
jgi:hypothetical protein